MTVTELVNRYTKTKSDEDCMFLIHDRVKRTYVPFLEKNIICKRVLDFQLSYGQSSGLQYIIFFLQLISSYTDIAIQYIDENGKFVADHEYDRLKQSGLLGMILSIIPEDEISEFNFVMNYTVQDKETYGDQMFDWSNLLNTAGGQSEEA